jgi:phosphate:Na+ symporter
VALVRALAGLLLFLMGMKIMGAGLAAVGQEKVQRALASLAEAPLQAFVLGALVTGALQSSSLTTVLVVGLVHGGLLALPAGIAVILGANVGTTLTAHLVAFEIQQFGGILVTLSLLAYLLNQRVRYISLSVLGFGILLTGMHWMTGGLAVLTEAGILEKALELAEVSPLRGILAGSLASALIQSSSAVTAFVIALSKENAAPLAPCLYLIFGADIGTCVTSLLASTGTNRGGKRAALAHLIFNCFSALIILMAAPAFIRIVTLTSPHLPRQVANGHSLYNLLGGLLFLPFVKQLARLVYLLIPDK